MPPPPAPPRLSVAPIADPAALAAEWQALEAAADASFFQSWTWVGCHAAERYPAPWLLRAERDGATIGLALLNRVGRRLAAPRPTLWLGESGDPAWDAAYVEHNGPLLADAGDLSACLAALLAAGNVRLSGVAAPVAAAAATVGRAHRARPSPAPHVDLSALAEGEGGYLASLSANTRYQLRRSDRAYGGAQATRAASLEQAMEWLEALAALHQATWTARGRPGAFANPAFRRFHAELLRRAWPARSAEVLRIQAGDADTVGYLYNFRWRGATLAYQSGFDYAAAPPHGKPGLTCHHAAIRLARAEGMRRYDFLAGGDRYKTSLANAAATLHWLELRRRWSPW